MIDLASYRRMLDDLLDCEEGLTSWEIGFIDDVSKRDSDTWTPGVKLMIEKIWNKVFG